MSYTNREIGSALLLERDRQGLTQRAFAKKAGTTQARVSKIETGETDARLSTIIEFARALELELMLVPREHVPAVKAIMVQQPISATDKAARSAIDRLKTLIVQLKEQFQGNNHLTHLERTARELTNFRLTSDRVAEIKRHTDALLLVQKTPALANTLDTHAAQLRQLRNEIAHSTVEDELARPAYRLDEDDDE